MLRPLLASILLTATISVSAQIQNQVAERLFKVVPTTSIMQNIPSAACGVVLSVEHNGLAVVSEVSYNSQQWGILLDRFDSCGDVLWSKYLCYGQLQDTRNVTACTTHDHGYLIASGYWIPATNFWGTQFQTVVFKLDSVGNTQWTRTIGDGINSQYPMAVAACPDGGYLIDTKKTSSATNVSSVFLCKIDSAGNNSWLQSFGNSPSCQSRQVVVNSSGKIFTSYSWNGNNSISGVRCFDPLGNTVYDDSLLPYFTSMLAANDSTLLFYFFQNTTPQHPIIFEMDENTTNILWTKHFYPPGLLVGLSLGINTAGNIMMMLGEDLPLVGSEYLMIILADHNGDSLTTAHYGNVVLSPSRDGICATTPDTGVAMYFMNNFMSPSSYLLVKLDGECQSIDNVNYTGISTPAVNTSLNAFPNPADNRCVVLLPQINSPSISVQRVDAMGRTVEEKNFQIHNGNDGTTLDFETTNWSPGIYTLRISDGKQVSIARVIIAR